MKSERGKRRTALNRVGELAKRLAGMKSRSVAEVTAALLGTRTLKRLGYSGGNLTEEQAQAAQRILEIWMEGRR